MIKNKGQFILGIFYSLLIFFFGYLSYFKNLAFSLTVLISLIMAMMFWRKNNSLAVGILFSVIIQIAVFFLINAKS